MLNLFNYHETSRYSIVHIFNSQPLGYHVSVTSFRYFWQKTGYIWVQSNEGNWSLVQGWEKEAEPQMCEIWCQWWVSGFTDCKQRYTKGREVVLWLQWIWAWISNWTLCLTFFFSPLYQIPHTRLIEIIWPLTGSLFCQLHFSWLLFFNPQFFTLF